MSEHIVRANSQPRRNERRDCRDCEIIAPLKSPVGAIHAEPLQAVAVPLAVYLICIHNLAIGLSKSATVSR